MKPVIIAVITFVVGTAGGTGAKVMMTKPLPANADSLAKSDSTKSDSTKLAGDSTKAESKTDTAVVQSGAPVKAPEEGVGAEKASVEPEAKPTANSAKAASAPIAAPKTARLSLAAVKLADSAKKDIESKPAAPPVPVIPDTAERRVAKVFTSMDAKQAAKVLEHMSDGDVQIILGYVGVKQAAAILAAFPPERVATLSKLAMRSGGASK
jgi:flagellar motility protein MotE (MotC chaperone)